MLQLSYLHPFSGAIRPITPDLLRSTYLVPRQALPFDPAMAAGAGDFPWSDSLAVAPSETLATIEHALRELMLATTNLRPEKIDISALPIGCRAGHHLDALILLWRSMGEALPDDLWVMRHVMEASASDALEPLALVLHDDWQPKAAERVLAERLRHHHGLAGEDAQRRYRAGLIGREPRADAASLLGHVQRNMLAASQATVGNDGSLQSFGLRDEAMQADVAAGIAQRLLDRDPALLPADIGLLMPRHGESAVYVAAAFVRAGLPLSGLPAQADRRDLAGEMLLQFVLTRRPPAPAMALASLLSSPLMPWPQPLGQELAAEVMRGRYDPAGARSLSGRAQQLYRIIRNDAEPSASTLAEQLKLLERALTSDPALRADVERVRSVAEQLRARLAGADAAGVPWDELLRLAAPAQPAASSPMIRTTGGITVLCEDEEPWREVRHLIVLGFCEGAFPARSAANPLFLDSEIDLIESRSGLSMASQKQLMAERLELFRRQLGTASQSVTLLVPSRTLAGKRRAPATSLPLLTRGIPGLEDAEAFILDLDSIAEADWPDIVPRALETKSAVIAPPLAISERMDFGKDLFTLRPKEDGSLRRQSPSRLETLIVSPFAWLLNELGAANEVWAPEAIDVTRKGTLAHEVFEHLFVPGEPLPTTEEIRARVPQLLLQRIRKTAPFMQSAGWALERASLEDEIVTSALAWRNGLEENGATVIQNEFFLRGSIFGIEVHGRADCLLKLEGGQLVIVDHKKSGSRRRQQRLDAGWDLQVELYRRMAQGPDSAGEEQDPMRELLASANSLGVAYHLMNDGGVLVHGHAADDRHGSFTRVDGDISYAALAKLEAEIERLRRGEIILNRAGDRKFYDATARIGPYAFDASPLVDAFSIPETEGAEADGDE